MCDVINVSCFPYQVTQQHSRPNHQEGVQLLTHITCSRVRLLFVPKRKDQQPKKVVKDVTTSSLGSKTKPNKSTLMSYALT